MNYNNLTDKQISLAVANAIPANNKERNKLVQMVENNELCYCRDWSATGVLIEKNGICITPILETPTEWIADKSVEFHGRITNIARSENSNPLRAASIVFLMMMEDLS